MIDLVFSLIDRLIQLVEHHQKVQKDMFKDFVEPIFYEFEKVNNQYLDSFRKYREMIRSSEQIDSDHPIFSIVEDEILMTSAQRVKLEELSGFSDDPLYGAFISSIQHYMTENIESAEFFIGFNEIPDDQPMEQSNVFRSSFLQGLGKIAASTGSEASKKQLTLESLQFLINSLNRRYQKVSREYAELKKILITPK
jgi:hypothetical protein